MFGISSLTYSSENLNVFTSPEENISGIYFKRVKFPFIVSMIIFF